MKKVFGLLFLLAAVVLVLSSLTGLAIAGTVAPGIPHGSAGFENCLSCHNSQSSKPLPVSHASYTVGTCVGCHSYLTIPQTNPSPAFTANGDAACLSCHGQPGINTKLPNGETLNLFIDPKIMSGSVHGNILRCTDCHTTITGYPHPTRNITSLREYSVAQYDLCKQCHFANYTKTLDSVHYKVLSGGSLQAPLCTDCHGAHNVSQPDQPRAKISNTCAKCHQSINDQYVASVHGKALIEDNKDVPVCTDCHKSHTIADPRTAAFRIESVDICSNCHSNAELMKKYNISTNVVKSYLQDFHGSTVALLSNQSKDIRVQTAVCTDCHGVHDIKAVNDASSHVIQANLEATCAKCHPNANANFPGAWLSHYQPSLSKTPLVFLVQWFYRLMIPFIVIGLSIHVLLDLWRAVTNR